MGQETETVTSIGDGYLQSYAEIPAVRITDPYLAAKKIGGHKRLFDPQDYQRQLAWYQVNRDTLVIAYGEELLDSVMASIQQAVNEQINQQ